MTARFDVFLSYASRDHAVIERIAGALSERGVRPFLDRWHLTPGQSWPDLLEQRLRECRAVAVLIGSEGLGRWQQREQYKALDRQTLEPGFPVIPVLLPGVDNPALGFLALNTWIDLRGRLDDPAAIDALVKAIRGQPPGLPDTSARADPRAEVCPYRGLQPFREEDAAFFFGRDALSERLVDAARRHSFFAVVGASGSGKSSVVRAGLIPRLRRGVDGQNWDVVTLVPGSRPLAALFAALNPSPTDLGDIERTAWLNERAGLLRQPEMSLSDVIRERLLQDRGTERLMLVVDQWEELYTQAQPRTLETDDDRRRAADVTRFIDLLLEATATDAPMTVALTLRGDFYGHAVAHRPLADRLDGAVVNIGPPLRLVETSDGMSELEQIVRRPAEAVGLQFQDGLVTRILQAVGDAAGNLPLLEFLLTELWKRRDRGQLTHEAYEAVGGVEGAIAERARLVFEALRVPEKQAAARRLFLSLVTPGEGREDTRARAAVPDDPLMQEVVQHFAGPQARLLVTQDDQATGRTVEVSHEALIRHWDQLREWVDDNRETLRTRERIRQRMTEWAEKGRDNALLLPTGRPLEEGRQLLANPGDVPVDDLQGYVKTSIAVREREAVEEEARRRRELETANTLAEEQKKRAQTANELADAQQKRAQDAEHAARRNRRLSLALAALVVFAFAAAIFSIDRFFAAEENEQVARIAAMRAVANESRALVALSEVAANRGLDFDALALALAAWPRGPDGDRPKLRSTIESLGRVLSNGRPWVQHLRHEDQVNGAVFNRDGTRILTWSSDRTARLWDGATGQEVVAPMRHEDAVSGAVFNGDGTRILTWSWDGRARLWDAASGKEVVPAMRHEVLVSSAVFNRDDTRILTESEDGPTRLWDAATGREVVLAIGHEDQVNGAVFNGDGTRLLTRSRDGMVGLWNAATGQAVAPAMHHEDAVNGAIFNGDGTRILTWSWDRTARLWDAATGQEAVAPMRHKEAVNGAVFNGDGTRILTWTFDGTARLWDATSGKEVVPSMNHGTHATGAVFSDDDTRILTWSEDNTAARLWDVATGEEVVPAMNHEEGLAGDGGSIGLSGAVFNNDGTRILTSSWDSTARLWDAATGRELVRTMRHVQPVRGAVFNRDETRILTWSFDGTARLWDVATGQEEMPAMRQMGKYFPVHVNVAFSGDETRILTWSRSNTVGLWHLPVGREVVPPMRHGGWVNGAVFSGDESRILTWYDDDAKFGSDETVGLWVAATGRELVTALKHQTSVGRPVFDSDGIRFLTEAEDGTLRLWNAATFQEVVLAMRHEGVIGAVFNSEGTRILTWSWDGTARLWDAVTGQLVVSVMRSDSLDRRRTIFNGAVFNSDGTRILTWSSDGTARLWDAATFREVVPAMRHEDPVQGAVFNDDESQILTWSVDNTARLWNTATAQEMMVLRHESPVDSAVFSSDESRILTRSQDGTVQLWDAVTGKSAVTMRHQHWVRGAVFDGDESRILTWSNGGTVQLWDAATGKEEVPAMRHEDVVYGAFFNDDQTRILTWSEDGATRLWDSATGQVVAPAMRHKQVEIKVEGRRVFVQSEAVTVARFNGDETRILTGSLDGTARLWDISRLPKGHLIDVACGMLPIHDTDELKKRYGIEITEPICGPNTPAPVWTELVD